MRGLNKNLPLVVGETKRERRRRLKREWLRRFRQTPKGRAYTQTLEYKLARRIYQKKYRQIPKVKAARKAYKQTPASKAAQKAYQRTAERKAALKVYRQTPKNKAYQTAYMKVYRKKYQRTLKFKITQRAYERKPEVKKARNKRRNFRRANNSIVKIVCCLRSHMFKSLKGINKSASTVTLLGCTVVQARKHLESQFKNNWSWDNHGKVWHIDHIRPLASFLIMNESEQRAAFHYTNLQPLSGPDNLKKGSLYNGVRYTRKKVWAIEDF